MANIWLAVFILFTSTLSILVFLIKLSNLEKSILVRTVGDIAACRCGESKFKDPVLWDDNIASTGWGNRTSFSVPNRAFYKELIKRRIGEKSFPLNGRTKMGIVVLSAFMYPGQVNVMITSEMKYGEVVYCRYFNKYKSEIGASFKALVFPEYTVICLRHEDASFISLSDTAEGPYDFPVPITDRTNPEPVHFFSVCLAPLFGTETRWLEIAEFVEHYRIQGATHFYIYYKEGDELTKLLIDDYVRTGDAEVIVLRDHYERPNRQWHHMEIQECLNRARAHSRWVAVVDLDERLTLSGSQGTIVDYLKTISSEAIGAIRFRTRWILKNETLPAIYTDSEQVASWMPTQRYHNTSHVGPPLHTTKCIIDPKKVLIMEIHYVEYFFENFKTNEVEPEQGVVRHYRDVNAGDWGKKWLPEIERFGSFSKSDYPKRWMSRLRTNVQNRLHHVYGGHSHEML